MFRSGFAVFHEALGVFGSQGVSLFPAIPAVARSGMRMSSSLTSACVDRRCM